MELSPLGPASCYDHREMKKTFALHLPGKDDQRVLEAVKNDVRKYVKRERRKALPEGVDFWDFDCKVGDSKAEPAVKHLAEVVDAIDAIAVTEATEVYVEILAKPGRRTPKPVEPASAETETPLGLDESPSTDSSSPQGDGLNDK